MARWKWAEIETMWRHPDWTAKELAEVLPHSEGAIRMQRVRMGRWNRRSVPLCCRCGEHPVWDGSPAARRWELCKGCYLDEERLQLELEGRAAALRQRRRKLKGA